MDKIIPVQVAVRIRPLNEKENNEGCQAALEQVEGEPQVSHADVDAVMAVLGVKCHNLFCHLKKDSHCLILQCNVITHGGFDLFFVTES